MRRPDMSLGGGRVAFGPTRLIGATKEAIATGRRRRLTSGDRLFAGRTSFWRAPFELAASKSLLRDGNDVTQQARGFAQASALHVVVRRSVRQARSAGWPDPIQSIAAAATAAVAFVASPAHRANRKGQSSPLSGRRFWKLAQRSAELWGSYGGRPPINDGHRARLFRPAQIETSPPAAANRIRVPVAHLSLARSLSTILLFSLSTTNSPNSASICVNTAHLRPARSSAYADPPRPSVSSARPPRPAPSGRRQPVSPGAATKRAGGRTRCN
jgi:hypothetical protein